jgi:hypothetical protein
MALVWWFSIDVIGAVGGGYFWLSQFLGKSWHLVGEVLRVLKCSPDNKHHHGFAIGCIWAKPCSPSQPAVGASLQWWSQGWWAVESN